MATGTSSSTANSESPRLPPPALEPHGPLEVAPPSHYPVPESAVAPPAPADETHYTLSLHALNELHSFPHGKLFPWLSHDTPYARSISSTAPGSPRLLPPTRQNSNTPRVRPHATTLNIPGLTRSRVSPDGRIASRDVGAKLVIIMVGLPARGKSYITNKLKRYIAWQQHHCKVFNVGNRRRIEVSDKKETKPRVSPTHAQVAAIFLNGSQIPIPEEPPELDLNKSVAENETEESQHLTNGAKSGESYESEEKKPPKEGSEEKHSEHIASPARKPPIVDQSAKFFDPKNEEAAKLRERFALESLDELLDYLLLNGGSVGILDATNSTLARRKALVERIQKREPKLGILFIESICDDPSLLEANMRLKLSGPDYKGKDPAKSLADFKERVKAYESAYQPIGDYEEENGFQYIKMIDVGRKIITHRLRGFLSDGIAAYLQTFNLSPRQIWITRHGQSFDNQEGRLGGDSELTDRGQLYSFVLYNFIKMKNLEWVVEQKTKIAKASFPPLPGDRTPPYPEAHYKDLDEKNFCVWTSMLKRSVDTARCFEDDDDFDVKAWECLNEMHAGKFEGLTYNDVAIHFPEEYRKRQEDKLHYIWPGIGGEGYLNVIGRLREMIREIERITDHVCIISHRSVCRVLMAYFMGLTTNEITDLDIPLGMLFSIEPKPYGIEFHAYRYNEDMRWFDEDPDYKVRRTGKNAT